MVRIWKPKAHSMQASKQRRSHHHSLHIMISLYGFRRRDIFFGYALGTKKGWQFLLLTIHCMSNSSMNTIATTATARVQFWSLSLYSRFVHTSIHYTNTDTRQCTIICIHSYHLYFMCECLRYMCMHIITLYVKTTTTTNSFRHKKSRISNSSVSRKDANWMYQRCSCWNVYLGHHRTGQYLSNFYHI